MMQHETGQLTAAHNTPLFFQTWYPAGEPRAVVILIHGLGEHSGRYHHVARHFTRRKIAVYSFDNRGHGRSPGKQGHIDTFDDLREDVRAMVKLVTAREPALPLLLMGHSLGGLIVLNYALHYPDELSGVCATSPQLGDPQIAPLLIRMSRVMARVWPSATFDTKLDAKGLSRDSAVIDAYLADPLVHSRGSARAAVEVIEATNWTQAHAHEFRPPLLLIHGDADTITDPNGTREFYEKVVSAEKDLIIYQGGYHENHNDIHRERVMADIGQWCDLRIKVATQNTPE